MTLAGARDEGHPCQIPLYSHLHSASGQIYLHPGPECLCVWLEKGLKALEYILVLVSCSQDFLNGISPNYPYAHQDLKYYIGNHEHVCKVYTDTDGTRENQMKRFHWDQDQIAHIKNCIANLDQQAQS